MNTVNQPIKDTLVLYLEQSPKGGGKTEVPRIGWGGGGGGEGGTRSVWGGQYCGNIWLAKFQGGKLQRGGGGGNAPRPSP